MQAQTTSRVLMIRPAAFGPNPETSTTNSFQGAALGNLAEIAERGRAEFDAVVAKLRAAGVDVYVFEDTLEPRTPDAIFPNNWFSTHGDGTVVLYPMQPLSRRSERRPELFASLSQDHGFHITRFVDFTHLEREGLYLEGTGSVVLDHTESIAYASLSARTRGPVLERFAGALGHDTVSFRATDHDVPVYHTNVVLSIGRDFAILAEEMISDEEERKLVRRRLEDSGHEIIPISREQCRQFAGNVMSLRTKDGDPVIVVSRTAWNAYDETQKRRFGELGTVIGVDIPTVETVGGGSVRCMIAELFLPRAQG